MERINKIGKNKYLAYGILGILSGEMVCLVILLLKQREVVFFLWMTLIVSLVCVVFAFARKIILGVESYSQYHYVLIILLCSFIVLRYSYQPFFYLDLTMLMTSVLLLFGRIGCLSAGCCYGKVFSKKSKWNSLLIRYGVDSENLLFTFPSQMIEAVMHGLNSLIVIVSVLNGYEYGIAFAWTLSNLAGTRFILEWLRGDDDRTMVVGFYETQWISLLLLGCVTILMLMSVLPISFYLISVFAVLIALMLLFLPIKNQFVNANDLNAMLVTFDQLNNRFIKEIETISFRGGWIFGLTKYPLHLSISNRDFPPSLKQVMRIQEYLFNMNRIPRDTEVIHGNNQRVFHLVEGYSKMKTNNSLQQSFHENQ